MRKRRTVRFEVVLQPPAADAPIVLRSSADPNTATLAFHEEFQRLTTQRATGELILRQPSNVQHPLLRQPLASGSSTAERRRRTCRAAPVKKPAARVRR